jgi:hypothetical protein
VAANRQRFTTREIKAADQARSLYRILARPSEAVFCALLDDNQILNCPVTSNDAKRALLIYGPDVATLKGKTVKKQNRAVPNYQPVAIPAPIIAQYQSPRIFVDIFFVNGTAYIHTITKYIKFRTVANIPNRLANTLRTEIRAVLDLYHAHGFLINSIEGDQEFSSIALDMLPTTLNIADADDHVPQAERSIRTIKDRTRCTVQGLPFQKFPRILTKAIVEAANRSLNQFPEKDSASSMMSPLTILTRRPRTNFVDLKLELGQYVQVFEDNDPSNTNKTRTTGAIALNPSDNAQGGYTFFSLVTGRKLSRQQWDELPMPNGVVARVEQMAVDEVRRAAGRNGLHFEWSPGVPIQDEQQAHIADFHQMPPAPLREDADRDEDDNIPNDGDEEDNNIPNPQRDPVTEDDSNDSAGPFYDENDDSNTEDDDDSTDPHDDQSFDKDMPDEEQVL